MELLFQPEWAYSRFLAARRGVFSSVLVLTLDFPPNSSQLLLLLARFALLLSVCYQPEKQKQKTKAEATKWRGQSVKRFARIGW